jgi:hypothetical protein
MIFGSGSRMNSTETGPFLAEWPVDDQVSVAINADRETLLIVDGRTVQVDMAVLCAALIAAAEFRETAEEASSRAGPGRGSARRTTT